VGLVEGASGVGDSGVGALAAGSVHDASSVEGVLRADTWARERAAELVGSAPRKGSDS
jgi:hypothetical protein